MAENIVIKCLVVAIINLHFQSKQHVSFGNSISEHCIVKVFKIIRFVQTHCIHLETAFAEQFYSKKVN